uniref:Uncharacterized protein n=1 Tax=Nelumbo nucifera TaxID=4432 RepID=A0A822ZU41_NELNU|nr:TPA_asm: hypothetical protein HUJ06_016343 [Nelumbo nucifera]
MKHFFFLQPMSNYNQPLRKQETFCKFGIPNVSSTTMSVCNQTNWVSRHLNRHQQCKNHAKSKANGAEKGKGCKDGGLHQKTILMGEECNCRIS